MMIIGCDFHPSWPQIAWLDTETGETGERKLVHADGDAERVLRSSGLQRRTQIVGGLCGSGTRGHRVHRTSASGCVPTGPATHTLIAYCDRLILKAKDGGTDEVHTLSSSATLTPSEVHSASQRPNDFA